MLNIHKVLLNLQQQIRGLDNKRTKQHLSVEYIEPKEGMVPIHSAYQTLCTALKTRKSIDEIVTNNLIELAAATIKFVIDLGDPVVVGDKNMNKIKSENDDYNSEDED